MNQRIKCGGIIEGKSSVCGRFLAESAPNSISILCPSCGNMNHLQLNQAVTLEQLQDLLNGAGLI